MDSICYNCNHLSLTKADYFGCGEVELFSCQKEHFDEIDEDELIENCLDFELIEDAENLLENLKVFEGEICITSNQA